MTTRHGPLRRAVRLVPAGLIAAVILAAPAPAAAADRYVDDSGANVGSCTSPAQPCWSLDWAIGQSTTGDVIHVGGGSYGPAGNLAGGVSLRRSDFAPPNTSGPAIVNGASAPAATVLPGAEREISGLTLRGGAAIASATLIIADGANVTISGNIFDDTTAAPTATSRHVQVNGGSPVIEGNEFKGADDGTHRVGIVGFSGATPTITANSFDSYFEAITVQSGPPGVTITANTITGIRAGATPGIPYGIRLAGASGTIADNEISFGPQPPTQGGQGIGISGANAAPMTLARNQVSGFPGIAIGVSGSAPISLYGDFLVDNGRGLDVHVDTNVAAENVTIAGSNPILSEFALALNATLSLDSSIIGAAGAQAGGGTCTITNSRGPTTSGNSCAQFQTTADPMFADPANGDYHLLPGSPMIDAGNPADPPPGAVDIDSDPRAIDGDQDCVVRRDIGADEFVPASPPPDCDPPETTITKGPKRKLETRKRRAKALFRFRSSEPGSTFECKLNRRPWRACSSPLRVRVKAKPKPKRQVFRARAINQATIADPTPAVYRWKVKRRN